MTSTESNENKPPRDFSYVTFPTSLIAIPLPAMKLKRQRFLGNTVVTITVIDIDDEKSFPVHKDLLEKYSDYFRAAFEDHKKEAEERPISIDDVPPSTFQMFLTWLYFQHLPPVATAGHSSILNLNIFSDRFRIPDLSADIFRLHHSHWAQSRPLLPLKLGDITKAYNVLPATSPMRRFLVDLMVFRTRRPETMEKVFNRSGEFPKDLLCALLLRLMELRGNVDVLPPLDYYCSESDSGPLGLSRMILRFGLLP